MVFYNIIMNQLLLSFCNYSELLKQGWDSDTEESEMDDNLQSNNHKGTRTLIYATIHHTCTFCIVQLYSYK